VKQQTYDPLEIIVVEDGSQTGIDRWISSEIPEAKYESHSKNRGLAAARNTGLENSSGEYVAYLDDDDKWKPERIARQIQTLETIPSTAQEDIGVVYCGLERRTPDGDIISVSFPTNEGNLADAIIDKGASTLPSTFLFDRGALQDVGGFDEFLPSSIDHDIWMSLATHGYKAVTVNEPLVITYDSEDTEQMTTNTITRIYGVKEYVKKWTPTYQDWFGPEKGIQYGERYFANVIARLARRKLEVRLYFEFGISVCAICSVCTDQKYVINVLFWDTIAPVAVNPLPNPLVSALKKVQHKIRN
jgi:glycosyltransferase involved in cell wall biosynthesis